MQTVDANGGSVLSAIGRLALTIHAEALPGPTAITIQPITTTPRVESVPRAARPPRSNRFELVAV